MALSKEIIHTMKDIYSLPEGQRAELIDGQFFMMAPPNTRHQRISGTIYWKIRNYLEKRKAPCEVFSAPFAVFLNADDKTYVEPDISVICDKEKLTDKGCNGAPDLIIEIASPSSQQLDYGVKLFKYRTAGVREYWIVNPMKNTVTVFDFDKEEKTAQYLFSDEIPFCIYEDLRINLIDD